MRNSLKTKMNWNAIYEYLDKRCYNVKLIYTYLDNLTCFNVKQWILLFFLIGSVLCNRNPFTPICVCACGGGDGGFNSCIALPHPQLFINCVFISGPSLRFSQYGNLCPWWIMFTPFVLAKQPTTCIWLWVWWSYITTQT